MKRRGFFSLVLVCIVLSAVFPTTSFIDLGTAQTFVVYDRALPDAETDSASTVTVITQEHIKDMRAQSTAELVGMAIGTTYDSYGSLGAAQSVRIRGTSASKTLVYLDGVLLTSAKDGTFDLSSIPVSIIERIEIIKSGAGNLGKTNAIGGIIHIVTKRPRSDEAPFAITFENGSFLPHAYGTSGDRDWFSLVDSQKLGLSMRKNNGTISVVNNLGGTIAANAYTYAAGITREKRENAHMHRIQDDLVISAALSEQTEYTATNLFSYQRIGVPGSTTWGLTPNDYQEDLSLSSLHRLTINDPVPILEKLDIRANYAYGKLFYHDATWGDSTHHTHTGSIQFEQQWNLGEHYSLSSGFDTHIDHLESTDAGIHTRLTPALHVHGSVYGARGRFSVHPALHFSYRSDTDSLSPNASIGAILSLGERHELKGSVGYAEHAPSFSQLYWPSYGNPDLETEKGMNVDIGYAHAHQAFRYEGTLFLRHINNAIANDSSWIPQNIARSLYLGTEQSIAWDVSDHIALSASYQYNKSFDLSDNQRISDGIEVPGIRKHTAKASLSYATGMVKATLNGEYLGESSEAQDVLLFNLIINVHPQEDLGIYMAIDNLSNVSYELTSGYPMPGTKVRVGLSWDIR